MTSGSRKDWIESHLLPDQRQRVELAARLRGVSITDFMVESIDEAAVRIIQQEPTASTESHPNPLFLPPLDQDLPRPTIRAEHVSEKHGRFTVEPLQRGFAAVLKTAIHRALMQVNSSTETAAMTAMRIEGAEKQYPFAIPGVAERANQIGFALGVIPLRAADGELKPLHLSVPGPEVVTSGMIGDQDGVEILDPTIVICNVLDGGRVEIEMRLKRGCGFFLEEQNRDPELGADFIPLCSNHCPIQHTSFKIGVAGHGHPAGYEKLILEIETKGSVPPTDLLRRALGNIRENVTDQDARKANLSLSTDDAAYRLDSLRTMNCLRNADIRTLGELVQKTEVDLLKLKGSGRKVVQEIKEILLPFGFSLGMTIDEQGYPQPGPTSVLSSAILAASLLHLESA